VITKKTSQWIFSFYRLQKDQKKKKEEKKISKLFINLFEGVLDSKKFDDRDKEKKEEKKKIP
jgi:hypothetical protein